MYKFKIGQHVAVPDPYIRKGVVVGIRTINNMPKYDVLFDAYDEDKGKLHIIKKYNMDENELTLHKDALWLSLGDVIKVLEKDHDAVFVNEGGDELKIDDHKITLGCENFRRKWKRKDG